MNPHYHPYGTPGDMSSPHPPSPDNNNFHTHPGGPGSHGGMHPNGHTIGSIGIQNGPGHNHIQQHCTAYTNNANSVTPNPDGSHHQAHHQNPNIGKNSNNNNTVKICAGCGGKINERFLLHALDRFWHNSCLKCSCCGAMLADIGTSCFTKGGMILCKQDYMRLFGSSGACSACGQAIPANEFVMRTGGGSNPATAAAPLQIFHIKCFMCSKCMAPLITGDRYYMLSGSLVCEQDWHKLLKSSAPPPAVRKGKVGRPRRSRD